MIKGTQKGTKVWQEICQSRKIPLICKYCGKTFYVPPYQSNRVFCNNECFRKYPSLMPPQAHEKAKELREEKYLKIKIEVEEWAENNKEIIQKCPYNKISTNLNEIYTIIVNKYNVIDWRTITLAVYGGYSRKEMLTYLKNL